MADSLQSVALEGPREHGGQKSFSSVSVVCFFSLLSFTALGNGSQS